MFVGVLTVSDRCSRGEMEDTAGPAVVALVHKEWVQSVIETDLLPDEETQIEDRLRAWSHAGAFLILTVGGTGLGQRDRTPEATQRVIDREAPGIAEAMRAKGSDKNPYAWLSRGVAGLIGKTLIVNLPGSKRAASESFEAILLLLRHGLEIAQGSQNHP